MSSPRIAVRITAYGKDWHNRADREFEVTGTWENINLIVGDMGDGMVRLIDAACEEVQEKENEDARQDAEGNE